MKKTLIALSLMLLCSSAFAVEGTCSAPTVIPTSPSGALVGNTCASDSNLTSLCLGLTVAGPQSVYSLVVGATSSLTAWRGWP